MPRPFDRRLRFGLRTLLGGVTLVAIALGLSRIYGMQAWLLAAGTLATAGLPILLCLVLLIGSPPRRRQLLPFLALALVLCFAAAILILFVADTRSVRTSQLESPATGVAIQDRAALLVLCDATPCGNGAAAR